MNKAFVLAATIALASVAATPAFSDDDTGPYIGGSVNRLSADFEDVNDVSFDDSDNALGAKAGYMFNNRFGIEVGYLDLGNYHADAPSQGIDINVDADGFYGVGVLNFDLADRWDLYGKLGVFVLDSDSDLTDFEESSTDLYGGVGVQYNLGNAELFGEFTKIDTDVEGLTIDVITVGLNYRFAQ